MEIVLYWISINVRDIYLQHMLTQLLRSPVAWLSDSVVFELVLGQVDVCFICLS